MGEIKGLIFDLGHTLICLDAPEDEVAKRGAADLAAFLMDRGFVLDVAAFGEAFLERRRFFRERARRERVEYTAEVALRTTLAEFGYPEVEGQIVTRGLEIFFAPEEAHWKTCPGALSTLQRLSKAGYRLGLISNASDDAVVQRLVDKAELRPWFDPIISSAGVGIRKPDPAIFQMALDEWGIAAREAVMIGDDPEADILGAKLAGMRSILVKRSDDPAGAQAADIVPDAEVTCLSQLPEVIASL